MSGATVEYEPCVYYVRTVRELLKAHMLRPKYPDIIIIPTAENVIATREFYQRCGAFGECNFGFLLRSEKLCSFLAAAVVTIEATRNMYAGDSLEMSVADFVAALDEVNPPSKPLHSPP